MERDAAAERERHYALQQALADALELARLQVEVLERLHAADDRGDDEVVQRCHAQLDYVMSRVAEVEGVRRGAKQARGAISDVDCANCGAPAEPVYETPHLLGYECIKCDWTAHEPAAQELRKRAQAKDAAVTAVERAVPVIEETLDILHQRGKRAREDGINALRTVQQDLAAVDKRLRNTAEMSVGGATIAP